jgi:hypothetical protein
MLYVLYPFTAYLLTLRRVIHVYLLILVIHFRDTRRDKQTNRLCGLYVYIANTTSTRIR